MRILMVGNDWHGLFQRPQQLAVSLARCHSLLFWGGLEFWVREWLRIRAGQRSALRLHEPAVRPNLDVVSLPRALPWRMQDRWPRLDFTLNALPRRMLAAGALLRTWDVAFLETYAPQDRMLWEQIRARIRVYDCYDDNAQFFPPGSRAARRVADSEARAVQHADLVTTSAPRLTARLRQLHPRVVEVPNGADAEHFALRSDAAPPAELAALTGPVLGFVGALYAWIDVELIEQVSVLLPEYTVVLVGPEECDVTRLRNRANIRLLGRRAYGELPALVRRFDVAMIPFRDNELTRSVDPVKFYEYSAAGKPVVSTPLPSMVARAGIVYIAQDAAEFAGQVRRALAEDNADRRGRRQEIAVANSWQARARVVLDALQPLLDEP